MNKVLILVILLFSTQLNAAYISLSNQRVNIDYDSYTLDQRDFTLKNNNPYHANYMNDLGLAIGQQINQSLSIEFNYFRDEKYKNTRDLKTGLGVGFIGLDFIFHKSYPFNENFRTNFLLGGSYIKSEIGELHSSGGINTGHYVNEDSSMGLNIGFGFDHKINTSTTFFTGVKYIMVNDLSYDDLEKVNEISNISNFISGIRVNF